MHNQSAPSSGPAEAGIPVAELWRDYCEARSTARLSEHSWARFENEYAKVSEILERHLGRPPASTDLTLRNLRRAFATYSTERVVRTRTGLQPRGRSTIAGCMSTWSQFLTYLVTDEVIPGNPMAGMERPRIDKRTPKALQGGADTVARLLACLDRGGRPDARYPWPRRDLALIATYVTTGLRLDELAQANIGDVDTTPGRSRVHVLGKGRRERWQEVPDGTLAAIAEFQAGRIEHLERRGLEPDPLRLESPLICNDRGERLNASNIRYIVEESYKAAGIRGSVPRGALVHALRHTYATALAEDRNPATIIQRLLGHGSLVTSQQYVSVSDETVRAAAHSSSLAQLLEGLRSQPADSTPRPIA